VNADHTATFTTTTNPCTLAAGTGPTAGFLFPAAYNGEVSKIDSSTGELKYAVVTGSHRTVSVDPSSGHVLAVAGSTSVQELDASGALEATEVATIKTSDVRGVAADEASGEIYLGKQTRVEIYEAPIVTLPEVVTAAASGNTGTHATLNGTVNPDGVELSECSFEWTQSSSFPSSFDNTVPCAESPAEIGTGTSAVAVHADLAHLTPQGTHYYFRLVAVNPEAHANGSTLNFDTANTIFTEAASGITDTAATLNGSVNPDGVAIAECEFEWGLTTAYGNTAPCVPGPGGIGTGTSPVAVAAEITGLHPGTVYHYRLRAANADGPIAPAGDETLQTSGPVIADTWAEDVLITEAVLKAEINPKGLATTYRFEYGTSEAYGSETEELNVGSDSSVHKVLFALEGLQPGTEYHYRVVATNADGENEGPDRQIRTFRPFSAETDCPNQANRYGTGAALPDCRAYEMVSPLDKNGGDIKALGSGNAGWPARATKSTPSGDKLTYSSYRAFADALSVPWSSQYIAQRQSGGWQTHAVNPPQTESLISGLEATYVQYQAFTDDLCHGWLWNFGEPVLSPAGIAGIQNIYRRNDRLCGPEGFEAMSPVVAPAVTAFQGASADGSHAIFSALGKLAPEGTEGIWQLYESVEPESTPRFVCILPNGEPWTGRCGAGSGENDNLGLFAASLTGAISDDGQRIFWTTNPGPYYEEGKLYVRIGGTETLPVSEGGEAIAGTTKSFFQGAAADGSRAIYTTNLGGGEGNRRLFAFDVDTEATEPIAEGVYGVLGISEDARQVYFVSGEAIPASGQNSEGDEAVPNQPNLYLYDADEEGGSFAFIGTLASGDTDLRRSLIGREPTGHKSRVTPDGRYVAFASFASLTGYDNENLTNGSLNPLAYVYDAATDELVCASCIPSGARGEQEPFTEIVGQVVIRQLESAMFPLRLLVDGRLFFQSGNALTPRDSNGKIDVYQWEQEGRGGCDVTDSTYAPSASGCISLISSGTSAFDSEFTEASASGDDVFIYTTSSLVPQDYGLRDIYDARVGGGFPLPPEAPECVGDACQSIPAAPNDPTPASASFHGAGDPTSRRNCRSAARRAAKLSGQAKRLRRAAKRSSSAKRKQALQRRSARFAKSARRLSKNAKRCRRNNRRAGR
jgi:hypothetical protein